MIRYSFIIVRPLSSFQSESEIHRSLALIRKCGYEGVELNLTEPLGINKDLLQEWLTEFELAIPSFLTGEAYFEGLCLSSSDSDIRQKTVKRLIRYVEVCKKFNAVMVVGLLQGLHSDEPNIDVANDRIVGCLRSVADVAEDKGVKMVIEPVNHLQVGFNNSVAEVLNLVRRVDSPSLFPMVDTIHMNIEEKSLVQPIRECGARLRHVHLCESNGGPFGTGNVDFKAVLKALRDIEYKRFASVKVYQRAKLADAARSSMKFLQRLAIR